MGLVLSLLASLRPPGHGVEWAPPALWGRVGHAPLEHRGMIPLLSRLHEQKEVRIPLLAKTDRLAECAPLVLHRQWAGLGGGLGVMSMSPDSAWERGRVAQHSDSIYVWGFSAERSFA